MRKFNLSKYIDVENTPKEVLGLLWEQCKRNKNIRPILCNASFEAGKVTPQEFQLSDYKRNIFSELSDQKRAKFKVITAHNKVLGLETSFAGKSMPIKRKDFMKRVKPILENKDVKSLFKYMLPKEEDYVSIVNSIYKKWMGKTKIVCSRDVERLNGKRVTLYIMQETTITLNKDSKIPILKYIAPYWTAYIANKEMEKYEPIDLECNYINQLKIGAKELDEENRILQEKRECHF